MRKFYVLGWATGLLLTLQSCGLFGGPVVKKVTVESYQTQCAAPSYPFVQTLCMVMLEPNGERTLVTGIGDFDYEWGHRYVLVIEEREPDPNLADSPPVLRDLAELVSKKQETPGTPFEMRLETVFPARDVSEGASRHIITREAPDRFAFFKRDEDYGVGREFTCEAALCEEMSALIEQELELTLEFAHPESSDEPLLLKRVVDTNALPEGY